ncbi:MAG: EAL domain-containing protein [Gallionella sp.]|jgi:diguanylate cyclase (GGDEF)-like protein/PAS domain S-box-containing protein|nr:EAL domain-containing protein [Gallionella sp.]MCK9354356.1 EAL domain-containing protein [Gallionella sp.]
MQNPFSSLRTKDILPLLGFALLYALLVRLVLSYLTTDGNISAVWIPSGLGVAAVLLGGRKYLLPVFLGALLAYVAAGRPLVASSLVALSNIAEPLVVLWLLSRSDRFDLKLDKARDYLWLVIAGTLASGVAAAIGASTLLSSGIVTAAQFPHGLMLWWMGNLLGIVLITPLLLIWRTWPGGWFKTPARMLETGALLATSVLLAGMIFNGWLSELLDLTQRSHLMLLPVAWAAIRFGRHGVSLLLLQAALQALLGAIGSTGHFANDIAETELVNYWSYVMTGSFVGIVLATIFHERRQNERRLAESQAQMQAILDHAPVGIWLVGADGRYRFVNKQFCESVGIPEQSFLETDNLRELMGREMAENCLHSDHACMEQDKPHVSQETMTLADGRPHVLEITKAKLRDRDGKITGVIGISMDVTARKQAEEMVWRQANFDMLTGLPNRHMFRDRITLEIRKSQRSGMTMALLLIDLDRFKEVNDTLGHDMGDRLLVEAAQRIVGCVRGSDTVARLGGDEFTVILPELEHSESIGRIAQNIIDRLTAPFTLGQDVAYVSASIGIALYPDDAADIDSLLKHADQAMYLSKDLGRNRFSYFTPALQQNAQKRLHLTNDLRNALAGGQLRLHYQPIVELATGDIHKAEALVRWQHPTLGLIGPADFIPLAEETGLIVDIGDWVFHQAAHQSKRWQVSHNSAFQISVNKSPMQFRSNESAASTWLPLMQELGLAGRGISIEITEGLLLHAEGNTKSKLSAYRDAGVQIAIDDFGTGYSSLAYLREFDIDHLKIDQSFVRNMENDPDSLALCEAIIVMAHKLGLKVIAEGVETVAQRDLLKNAGCDYAQGYLFSRPVPAEELEVLLEHKRNLE